MNKKGYFKKGMVPPNKGVYTAPCPPHRFLAKKPGETCVVCGATRQKARALPCPNADELRRLASIGTDVSSIAETFSVGRKVIWRWMAEHQIPRTGALRAARIAGYGTPTWHSWASMRTRVTNPNRKQSHRYVGRGIDCDPRWAVYDNFLTDMGERRDGTTLDRIDNDRGYWPGNCRWSTPKQQCRNTSRNRYVLFRGERVCAAEAVDRMGLTWEEYRRARKRSDHGPQDVVDRLAARSA